MGIKIGTGQPQAQNKKKTIGWAILALRVQVTFHGLGPSVSRGIFVANVEDTSLGCLSFTQLRFQFTYINPIILIPPGPGVLANGQLVFYTHPLGILLDIPPSTRYSCTRKAEKIFFLTCVSQTPLKIGIWVRYLFQQSGALR